MFNQKKHQSNPIVLVTGVSSGIGLETVKLLLKSNFKVIGSFISEEEKNKFSNSFHENFFPISFDVTKTETIILSKQKIEEYLGGQKLFGLINNAGIAHLSPLLTQEIDDFKEHLNVNLIGMFSVIQTFFPLMATKQVSCPSSRIINISSVSGSFGWPFLGAYSASKHAVEGLSESLRRELLRYGIEVVIIAPGYVNTPIWTKLKNENDVQFNDDKSLLKFKNKIIQEGSKGIAPEKVAEVILQSLMASRPKHKYVVVPNLLLHWYIPKLLPKKLLDKLICKKFDMLNPNEN
ncbi:MAG: SDR family oxidoreductase [Bacteriovorax sp.]